MKDRTVTSIGDLRPVSGVRGPVGPVLLLPCLTIVGHERRSGGGPADPPLEQLGTAVRIGRCEDCGAVWPAIDDSVRMPVFRTPCAPDGDRSREALEQVG